MVVGDTPPRLAEGSGLRGYAYYFVMFAGAALTCIAVLCLKMPHCEKITHQPTEAMSRRKRINSPT